MTSAFNGATMRLHERLDQAETRIAGHKIWLLTNVVAGCGVVITWLADKAGFFGRGHP